MARVRVESELDARGFQTGLQRLAGSAARFGEDLQKKLSFKGVASSILGGLGIGSGFLIADKLSHSIAAAIKGGSAEGWKAAQEAAKSYGDFLDRDILSRFDPEKQIEILQHRRDLAQQVGSRPQKQFGEGEGNWFIRNSGGLFRGLVNRMGWFGAEDEATATERQQQARLRAGQLDAEVRQRQKALADAKQAADDQRSAIMDQRRVRRGDMTSVDAARAEQDRAGRRHLETLADKTRAPGEAERAFNDLLRAQDATTAAEETDRRFRLVPRLPQISANSLAQVGGGGNVNVFGGGNEMLTEARAQTTLLRDIARNTAGGSGRTIDISL